VTVLSFVGLCNWDSQAARAFVDYLQRPVENDKPSLLKELKVHDLVAFEGRPEDTLLEEMLTVPTGPNDLLSKTCRTIGSSIQCLETSGHVLPEVMDALVGNAQTMRICSVRFSKPVIGHELAAFRCNLPKLLYLKDLSIGHEKNEWSLRWNMGHVLEALRANGSLVRLSLKGMTIAARVQQRLDAYLQRNKSLPALLANPPPRSGKKPPAKNIDGPLDLSLFPSLFKVSKSMPAISANMILIGLLAAAGNRNIGPATLDGKRAGMADISNR
jgi:hypothetical protein